MDRSKFPSLPKPLPKKPLLKRRYMGYLPKKPLLKRGYIGLNLPKKKKGGSTRIPGGRLKKKRRGASVYLPGGSTQIPAGRLKPKHKRHRSVPANQGAVRPVYHNLKGGSVGNSYYPSSDRRTIKRQPYSRSVI